MPGEFIQSGQGVFPSTEIPCTHFEWRADTQSRSPFSIRFISADERGPRRFWVDPLLRYWQERTPTDFVQRACEFGTKVVAEIDSHSPEDAAAYRLASHLFRNRHAGHTGIRRELRTSVDFVDFSEPANPSLITPGIGDVGLPAMSSMATQFEKARQLLKRGFRQVDPSFGSFPPNLAGVTAVYDRIIQRQQQSRAESDNPLGGVSKTDKLFITRVLPQCDFEKIENQVASALIYGTRSLREDFEAVRSNWDAFLYFIRRLGDKAWKPGMRAQEFDGWLRNLRQKSYLHLVEGDKLKGAEKREPKQLALSMYRVLLWTSYRMMAHCYGVVMFLVRIAMGESEHPPTKVEDQLFALHNGQVDYLAGLPLAFLGRPQMPWIIHHLSRLYLIQPEVEEFARQGQVRADSFADIPQSLGLFGTTVRERRRADKRTKGRR